MKLFIHYCPQGFSNCYIFGTSLFQEGASVSKEAVPQEAIIIDPGSINADLLDIIEHGAYKLRGVFITHDHPHHVHGLRTIMRIYDTQIYAINSVISEFRTNLVRDGDVIEIGSLKIEVISVPGHSADSAVFRIGRLLFTGDTLSAGLVGDTSNSYAAATQITTLRSKILSLPGDYSVFPGHGPPSSLEAERRFNLGLNTFELHKTRRPTFRFEF